MYENSEQNNYTEIEATSDIQLNGYENVVYYDSIECVKIARSAVMRMFIDDALFNQTTSCCSVCTFPYHCFPNELTAQCRNLLVVSPEEESETLGLRCERCGRELYRSWRAIKVCLRVEGESEPEAVWGHTLQSTDTARINVCINILTVTTVSNIVAQLGARDLSCNRTCRSYREACHRTHWQPAMSCRHACCV